MASAAPHVEIFTDSLAALYLTQRIMRSPDSLTECKHMPLLQKMQDLILKRARLGFHTALFKVRAHIGIAGNEAADAGAAKAIADPDAFRRDMPDDADGHSRMPHLQVWPCVPAPTPGPNGETELWFAADLSSAIRQRAEKVVYSTAPPMPVVRRRAPAAHAPPPGGVHWAIRQEINEASHAEYSNHMWRAGCTWGAIKTVLNVRFGTLWTAQRARQQGCGFPHPGSRPISTGTCPLCRVACDTPGHISAACSHLESLLY